MAKRRRNRSAAVTARRTVPTPPLGHTAVQRGYKPWSSPVGAAFSSPTVRPLIRTVRVEPEWSFPVPPVLRKRSDRFSPAVAVRATGRSDDRVVRSPFLNATMVSPQLTERAIICAKRNIRKEVLFATKQTGKGSRSPRRTPSKVKC